MSIYTDLGVTPVINAAGTFTHFGGSLMPPEVTQAMVEASRAFVPIPELHTAAGQRIAGLLGVEAAHVCGCAAAGIALMAAACLAGADPEKVERLPDTAGLPAEFIVQRSHRNYFDRAVRLAGGRFVEVDAQVEALEAALSGQTAAVAYTHAWFVTGCSLPLAEVASLAHRWGVPVIVDAAAELPPAVNLTRFLAEGADLVAFSGGKMLRGPQSSGLILGRADLVAACAANDSPHMGIGRAMKAGKEEIAGLVRAVELYLGRDHAAEMAEWERRVAYWVETLGEIPGVRAFRRMPQGVGQLVPHCALQWDEAARGLSYAETKQRLLEGRPRVAVWLLEPEAYDRTGFPAPEIRLNPHTLQPGEEEIVARRVREVVGGKG